MCRLANWLALPCALLVSLVADVALAQPSFRLNKLYSTPSGDFQMIELVEFASANGQDRWMGLTLVASDRHGTVKQLTFASDLPHAMTAGTHVLIATSPEADFEIPPRFLPTDGGTITFAGVDNWTYVALPNNGLGVLRRDATPEVPFVPPRVFRTFVPTFEWESIQRTEQAIEYRHAGGDRYFVTIFAPDIDALDSGRIGGWSRTGESTEVWINTYYDPTNDNPGISHYAQPDGLLPVCRLYLPLPGGPSHFYSASADECAAALQNDPRLILESSQAFLATLPDPATGICAQEARPLYRLWNRSAGVSHRFTPSKATRDAMVAQGWTSEGNGPDGVAMCTWGHQ